MTVCIAASCRDQDTYKIVICTDTKISSALGSSEARRKEHYLSGGWKCLTAGVESEYLALVRLYGESFRNPENITATTIDATIKEPLYRRKRELADEYIRTRFAISYEDFLKTGKDKLPAEIFYESVRNIQSTELQAELIIAGFIDSSPEIYYTDKMGVARAAAEFATVGEGEYLASSVLLRRKQNSSTSLEKTLYNVYEAKKFAEAVGSVGRSTQLSVLECGVKTRLTSFELDRQLADAYREYGPKDLPSKLKFEGDYYYRRSED